MIKIIQIAQDRQSCVDDKGIKHSIKDVKLYFQNMNVHAISNRNKHSKFNEVIAYKKYCKPQSTNQNVYINKLDIKIVIKLYNEMCEQTDDLCIITEDGGSAIKIIEAIVARFAYNNGIKLRCCFIRAKGVGNIINALNYQVPNHIKKCLVVYDSALQDLATLNAIRDNIAFLNSSKMGKYLAFTPRCSEECALSFKKLKSDIVGLNMAQLDILNAIETYHNTGDEKGYIRMDTSQNGYMIGNKLIKLGYTSQYIKKYKVINSLERFIADKLAEITNKKPYQFIKNAEVCWYENCSCNNARCVLEKS